MEVYSLSELDAHFALLAEDSRALREKVRALEEENRGLRENLVCPKPMKAKGFRNGVLAAGLRVAWEYSLNGIEGSRKGHIMVFGSKQLYTYGYVQGNRGATWSDTDANILCDADTADLMEEMNQDGAHIFLQDGKIDAARFFSHGVKKVNGAGGSGHGAAQKLSLCPGSVVFKISSDGAITEFREGAVFHKHCGRRGVVAPVVTRERPGTDDSSDDSSSDRGQLSEFVPAEGSQISKNDPELDKFFLEDDASVGYHQDSELDGFLLEHDASVELRQDSEKYDVAVILHREHWSGRNMEDERIEWHANCEQFKLQQLRLQFWRYCSGGFKPGDADTLDADGCCSVVLHGSDLSSRAGSDVELDDVFNDVDWNIVGDAVLSSNSDVDLEQLGRLQLMRQYGTPSMEFVLSTAKTGSMVHSEPVPVPRQKLSLTLRALLDFDECKRERSNPHYRFTPGDGPADGPSGGGSPGVPGGSPGGGGRNPDESGESNGDSGRDHDDGDGDGDGGDGNDRGCAGGSRRWVLQAIMNSKAETHVVKEFERQLSCPVQQWPEHEGGYLPRPPTPPKLTKNQKRRERAKERKTADTDQASQEITADLSDSVPESSAASSKDCWGKASAPEEPTDAGSESSWRPGSEDSLRGDISPPGSISSIPGSISFHSSAGNEDFGSADALLEPGLFSPEPGLSDVPRTFVWADQNVSSDEEVLV